MGVAAGSQLAHWINGDWAEGQGSEAIGVVDPSTEDVIGSAPAGTPADVNEAVSAAASSFEGWSATPFDQRLAALEGWHEQLSQRADELAEVITGEVGTPLAASRAAQVGIALGILRGYLDHAAEVVGDEHIGNSVVAPEPAGVAVCITPWNLPLIIAMQKLPAALLAGCTVVLKPSELTPLNVGPMVEAARDAGIPSGALNVVFGAGPSAGEALVSHPDVSVVSFTGSTRAGRRVAQLGAETIKRMHLELGGKSASVILEDADLEPTVRACVDQAFFNCGQSCIVWSRMLVPRARLDEAEELAAEAVSGYRVGSPRDADTDLGPLVSAAAHERVTGYIEKGQSEGARLLAGGAGHPPGLDRGYFIRPTVFSDVDRTMTIAREEIFGPVLSIMPYGSEDEAVEIANDSVYGLHGSVWSSDEDQALAVARRLQTGRVDVNGAPFNLATPFGGYKQSGVGRELGRFGIEEFLELKSIQLPDDDAEGVGVGARGGGE